MPNTVEFEIDDDLMPVEGVAVLICYSRSKEDSTPVVISSINEPKHHSVVGLLQVALDQAREQAAEGWEPTEED